MIFVFIIILLFFYPFTVFNNKYHSIITVEKSQVNLIKKSLKPEIDKLVEKYSQIMGVTPETIKITSAEKRWGSCNDKKSVCFSYKCAFLSQKCKEYIVIHELSHLKELNHSKAFYDIVKTYMPDYKETEKELNGYYIHIDK